MHHFHSKIHTEKYLRKGHPGNRFPIYLQIVIVYCNLSRAAFMQHVKRGISQLFAYLRINLLTKNHETTSEFVPMFVSRNTILRSKTVHSSSLIPLITPSLKRFKRQLHEKVKHTQTICRQITDESFESIWPFCGVSTLHWPSLLFLLRAKPLLIYWGTESVNLLHPLLTLVVTLSTTPHQARTSAFLFPVQSGVIFNTGWKFKRRRPKVP